MTKIEKVAGILSCVLAMLGSGWFLLIMAASAMSDAPGSVHSMPLAALPLPSVAFGISVFILIAAYRRRSIRPCLAVTVPALILSMGPILLALVALIF